MTIFKNRWAGTALLVASGMLLSNATLAEEMARTKLSFGYYAIIKADTYVALNGRNTGSGVSINPSDTFGTDFEQSVFRFDGRYRFAPEHGVALTWYRVSSTGYKVVDEDIEWVDQEGNDVVINAGATLNSKLSYDIFKANYLWSFYHNDKVELTTSAGLHGSSFKIALDAENNVGATANQEERQVSSTIPLPNLGLGIEYSVNPRFSWFLKADLFAMRFNDWSGSFADLQLGMEYRVMDYLGLGLGIGSTNLNVTETTSTYRLTYDNSLSGVNFYLTSEF